MFLLTILFVYSVVTYCLSCVFIQSAGLVIVHAHSRMVSVTNDAPVNEVADSSVSPTLGHVIQPDVPFWLFCLHQ